MTKIPFDLKKRVVIGVIAAVVNLVLILMMIIYFLSGAEQLALSILLPSALHISLCGTMLLFFFTDQNDSMY